MNIEVKVDYLCPTDSVMGSSILSMPLEFEGCPTLTITWQKNCGRDNLRKLFVRVIMNF